MLEEHDAAAGFFPDRGWAETNLDLIEDLHDDGYIVGVDGPPIDRPTKRNLVEWRRTVRSTERVLTRAGVDPRPFLLPSPGSPEVEVLRVAGRLGYRGLRPGVHPGEGSARAIAREVIDAVEPGSIVRLNLDKPSHRAALPKIMAGLERMKLATASLRRLLNVDGVPWHKDLVPGWEGPRIKDLQRRLTELRYDPGPIDGVYGAGMIHAVTAFEKVHGLERDGILAPADHELLLLAKPPVPPERADDTYIDVDITRQVLFEVRDGKLYKVLPISTANGAAYTSKSGGTAIAHTPRGTYSIYSKISGYRTSYLGTLYAPSYFYGGYAIHGSSSVPPYPASHGCIRIPMHSTDAFFARNGIGTPVYVHD